MQLPALSERSELGTPDAILHMPTELDRADSALKCNRPRYLSDLNCAPRSAKLTTTAAPEGVQITA
jgi:hypothetical protein